MAETMNKDVQVHWRDRKHVLWFPWTFTKYYITNERLMIEQGFFKTVVDETLLYRIVDITMEQTLAGKIFGTGTLIITAKADKTPEICLENIKNPRKIRTMLSDLVETSRHQRNVVGKEFYSGSRSSVTVQDDRDDEDESLEDDNLE